MTHEETKSLITLAAKAMGYKGEWNDDNETFMYQMKGIHHYFHFNPLASLADRAKMCDELEIGTFYFKDKVRATKQLDDEIYAAIHKDVALYETDGDRSLACSLACLRVAATIGKQLKGE